MTAHHKFAQIGERRHRTEPGRATFWVTVVAMFGVFLATGCAKVAPVDERALGEAFPFIRDGETNKQEILNRFGLPVHEYEGGRIISYFAQLDDRSEYWDAGQMRVGQSFGERYALMLVFGPDDVLERHSLVRER